MAADIKPKFSLILATLGRTEELNRFFESLTNQSFTDFEVLVIDQNPKDYLKEIIDRWKAKLNLTHLTSDRGLSKARNVGLNKSKGEIIAFPDDDCWYPKDLLKNIASLLEKRQELHGVTGRCVDENLDPSVGRWSNEESSLNRNNVWWSAVSITIFLREAACRKIGLFDENLGVGANSPYQSGEESDYLLRAFEKKISIRFLPEVVVGHPQTTQLFNSKTWKRGLTYGKGMGYVLKKHNYDFLSASKKILRPFLGFLLSLLTLRIMKSIYHLNVFWGRLQGWQTKNINST